MRSIRIAAQAAPKPLPVLTTVSPGGAAGQRRGQRRRAVLAHAIAAGRRQGDDRRGNQPGQHREQCALHPRHRDQHAVLTDLLDPVEQPPQPGDPDIGNHRRGIAVKLQRPRRLACKADVRGASRHDPRPPAQGRGPFAKDPRAAFGVIVDVSAVQHLRLVPGQPRQKEPVAARADLGDDGGDLRGAFALAEDSLGCSGPAARCQSMITPFIPPPTEGRPRRAGRGARQGKCAGRQHRPPQRYARLAIRRRQRRVPR